VIKQLIKTSGQAVTTPFLKQPKKQCLPESAVVTATIRATVVVCRSIFKVFQYRSDDKTKIKTAVERNWQNYDLDPHCSLHAKLGLKKR